MEKYEVAIIGGGFSGLVTAIALSEHSGGENVAVFERNDRVGKKILATGNGRGNISNLDLTVGHYHSAGKKTSALNAIEKYGYKSIIGFFNDLGIPVVYDGDRIYPSSLQASSVLDMMRLKLSFLQTGIKTNAECVGIKKTSDGFIVSTKSGEYFAKYVVFAAGGKAGRQYGTDGKAFGILEKLGVGITPLYPAIVQLKTETTHLKGLKGLKEKALAKAYDGDKFLSEFYGDVLFTDYGVSGNAVFYLSSYLVGAKNPVISLSFTDKTDNELFNFLMRKVKSMPYISSDDILTGVINKQTGRAIAKRCGANDTSERSIKKIVDCTKDFRLKVIGTLGFDYAQVTRGGVELDEITDEMELKKIKGLFVTGEALDIDGDCGGYNLQWAYSSAMTVAERIIKAENEQARRT